jgi:cyclohexyl-isocyanide hydratase
VSIKVAIIIFPDVTQLDFTGPYEVFASVPQSKIFLLSESLDPVKTERGMRILPDSTWDTIPDLDIVLVPGGPGINALLCDKQFKQQLKKISRRAKYISSVCTGSLLLAAAGLLDGYRATTHWRYLDLLKKFNVDVAPGQRVVVDRTRITGGGVSAGIDLALFAVKELCGEATARRIQLALEYEPAPPFNCGSPSSADEETLAHVFQQTTTLFAKRESLIDSLF